MRWGIGWVDDDRVETPQNRIDSHFLRIIETTHERCWHCCSTAVFDMVGDNSKKGMGQ